MKAVLKFLLILLAIIVIAALCFYFFVYNKPHVDYSKSDADIEIKAEELFSEYVKNPLAAAKKYNGKVLMVSGTVDAIEQADELTIAVMILDEGFFGPEGVRFSLLENQVDLIDIGKPVNLKGLCTGYTEADVVLEHASIVAQ
ncbi:MAG TPA: hypothetical protein PKH45_01310 [Tenuifilaceae bacterium]|nr:hypothetical protein [Tenuifilaceae bacterium]